MVPNFAGPLLGLRAALLLPIVGVALNSRLLDPTGFFSGRFCVDPDYGIGPVRGLLGYDTLDKSDLFPIVYFFSGGSSPPDPFSIFLVLDYSLFGAF